MAPKNHHALPLVYSCSGCSNIAQLANQVAIELDRDRVAQMSCIAGVGGSVVSLLKIAQSAQTIISLDGCPLHCVKSCLAQHNIESTHHYTLTDYGVKKKYHMDFAPTDVSAIKDRVINDIKQKSGAR
jgi:uncharacterized metal-binding protein